MSGNENSGNENCGYKMSGLRNCGIKICGLSRDCDIGYVNEAMPDYIGFILLFPGSRRSISPDRASQLKRRLRPGIQAAGVFVDQPAGTVLEAAKLIGLDVIQLHGHEDNGYISSLREKTDLAVWKAFKVRTEEDLAAARESIADKILLDNGYGTGEVFDWSLLTGFSRPFILAGGLTPDTIPGALRVLNPELIDISSGVETDKVKDKEKILAAVRAVRNFAG